jgi:hypothetical protein
MTDEEVAKLCRYIKAACPSQAFDDFTPLVWAEILPAHYTLPECRAAVIAIKQRQAYADVSDVIAEVKRARAGAADRDRLRVLLNPAAYRAEIEARDGLILAKIAARAGITNRAIKGPES